MACCACADDPDAAALVVDVVGPTGARLPDVEEVHIVVARGAGPPVDRTVAAASDGAFSLDVPFGTAPDPIRAAVELRAPTVTYLATLPPFLPEETSGFVRMIAAPIGRCTAVDLPRDARPGAAAVISGTFAILVGGSNEAPLAYVDLLRFEHGVYPERDPAIGPSRAVAIDGRTVLALNDAGEAYLIAPTAPNDRVRSVAMHPGAGAATTLVALDGAAAAIGADPPSTEATFVDPLGGTRTIALAHPRRAPLGTRLGEHVLVVGGAAPELVEIATGTSAAIDVAIPDDVVLVTTDGDRALLLTARGPTILLDGCPDRCVVRAGPDGAPLTAPRPFRASEDVWLVTSDERVDRIDFGSGEPTIRSIPLDPALPGGIGVAFGAGAVLVLDPASSVAELCIPEGLPLP